MIAIAAAATTMLLAFLALLGYCLTQRIQPTQVFVSAAKHTESSACTGQFCAHRPRFTQSLVSFGTSPVYIEKMNLRFLRNNTEDLKQRNRSLRITTKI